MAGTDITLPYLNKILPYLLRNGQLRQVPRPDQPFSACLSAFPLTTRASVVSLRVEQAELVFDPTETIALAGKREWYLVCLQESAEFLTNGGTSLLQPGDLLLIHSHSAACLRPRLALSCIMIGLQEPGIGHWLPLFHQAQNRSFGASNGWARLLSVYLRELNESFMDRIAQVPSDQAVCLETVLSLAVMMFRQTLPPGSLDSVPDRRRRARHKLYCDITVWLYLNFGQTGLTGKKVAREFRISVRTLHKLFNEFSDNASFAIFLNEIRMQNARKMLWDSSLVDLPVGDIGWLCGFADPAHFGKAFKKYHSITPRQMREAVHGTDCLKP